MMTYSNMINNTVTQHSIAIAPGGMGVAKRRTFMRNGVEFAIAITAMHLKDSQTTLRAPFPGVNSPTADYNVDIVQKGHSLKFTACASA
ncbi:hypothetical protein Q4I30_006067 [Leishmania utingensis]|uniref:Uncharacterized protein n=1 Tax=Leishmania utingensis TaxID=653362 RepID=A0AAW3A6N6_9TRYP